METEMDISDKSCEELMDMGDNNYEELINNYEELINNSLQSVRIQTATLSSNLERQFVGIYNINNRICYLNSILQQEYSAPQIRESYMEHYTRFDHNTFCYQLGNICNQMATTTSSFVRVNDMINYLKGKKPRIPWDTVQQDILDVLGYFEGCMESETKAMIKETNEELQFNIKQVLRIEQDRYYKFNTNAFLRSAQNINVTNEFLPFLFLDAKDSKDLDAAMCAYITDTKYFYDDEYGGGYS